MNGEQLHKGSPKEDVRMFTKLNHETVGRRMPMKPLFAENLRILFSKIWKYLY